MRLPPHMAHAPSCRRPVALRRTPAVATGRRAPTAPHLAPRVHPRTLGALSLRALRALRTPSSVRTCPGGHRGPFLPRHRHRHQLRRRHRPPRPRPGRSPSARSAPPAARRQQRHVRAVHRRRRGPARAPGRGRRPGEQGGELRPDSGDLRDLRHGLQPRRRRPVRPQRAAQSLDPRRRAGRRTGDVPARPRRHDPADHDRLVPRTGRHERVPGRHHLRGPRPGAHGRPRQGLGGGRPRPALRLDPRRADRGGLLGGLPHRLPRPRRARGGRRRPLHRTTSGGPSSGGPCSSSAISR